MTAPRQSMTPPRLEVLTARFLSRAANASSDSSYDATTDVEPYEVLGGFRADPRTGWLEVVGIARLFGVPSEKQSAPPEWSAYAALPNSTPAVPLAVGLFPQQVRDPLPLLASADLAALRPMGSTSPVAGFSGLRSWIRKSTNGKSPAAALQAVGMLLSLGEFAEAEAALNSADPICTAGWRLAWENQRAAMLWMSGRHAEAYTAWKVLGDHPVAAFNTGMAALFLGHASEAVPALKEAAASLPAQSGWSHLANLLLLVAQTRA